MAKGTKNNTIEGVLLLGWMDRDTAVRVLTQECVFDEPMTEASAERVWQHHREVVDALPERDLAPPVRLVMTPDEQREREQFLKNSRQFPNIRDVIKIDPANCIVHQLMIVTGRSTQYARDMNSSSAKVKHCLGMFGPAQFNMDIAAGPNAVNVRIPHGEFIFTFVPGSGFQVQQMARHITVSNVDKKLLLWAGYHRSYALMTNEYPEGMDRSLIAVLATDADFILSPDSPNQGVREMVRGLRPPLFRDFFDDRFFMRVKLRKKRCELHVRAQIMWFDDES